MPSSEAERTQNGRSGPPASTEPKQASKSKSKSRLTDKQKAFVEHYLRCWNATEAAKEAGYSEQTARSIGSENLTKPDIQSEISARLAEITMSANEVLVRLSEIAHGDIADFLEFHSYGPASINLRQGYERGKMPLVKKLTPTKFGTAIELHDPVAALTLLGKHHKLFTEKSELEHSGTITVDDTGLSDDERARRIASILDAARERRDRQAAGGASEAAVDAAGGAADRSAT